LFDAESGCRPVNQNEWFLPKLLSQDVLALTP
jgi:hypothetical protein